MRIFLSIDNGAELLEVPVVPGEFSISTAQSDETFETVDGSYLAFIDAPGLSGIGWSSFFPSRDYPYIKGARLPSVWQYNETLERWIKLKYPIRLIITETPINIAAKVTAFDCKMGPSGDLNYDIQFKEFPLIDTETEELTMAQYDELLAKINALELEVAQLKGGKIINTPEEGAPFYDQTLQKLVDGGFINGSGSGLDLTEDMARVLTIIDRAGGIG